MITYNGNVLKVSGSCLNMVSGSSQYQNCFRDCGKDSPTGSAELAQVPNDWK